MKERIMLDFKKVALNADFQAIAIVEAIKLLADKNNFSALDLMQEFVSDRNPRLKQQVAEMVIVAAKITAEELSI